MSATIRIMDDEGRPIYPEGPVVKGILHTLELIQVAASANAQANAANAKSNEAVTDQVKQISVNLQQVTVDLKEVSTTVKFLVTNDNAQAALVSKFGILESRIDVITKDLEDQKKWRSTVLAVAVASLFGFIGTLIWKVIEALPHKP